jgi:hypothetical protein
MHSGFSEVLIRITQLLPALSVPVAWTVLPAPPRQFAPISFCVANKPLVACACVVPGAVVPWNLYGLKIAETQSALNRSCSFLHAVLLAQRRETEKEVLSILCGNCPQKRFSPLRLSFEGQKIHASKSRIHSLCELTDVGRILCRLRKS